MLLFKCHNVYFNVYFTEMLIKTAVTYSTVNLIISNGVAAKVASTRLGHSSIVITMDLYSHVYSEVEMEAANKINQGIFNISAI